MWRRSTRPILERLEDRRMMHADLGGHQIGEIDPNTPAMPDFELVDTNATSPTYDQTVSPRDYLGSITGWYFGTAP